MVVDILLSNAILVFFFFSYKLSQNKIEFVNSEQQNGKTKSKIKPKGTQHG